ncbi:MAG: glutamate-5-semialdehyde dehydrogenase [Deltaproteobacteria bacterium]|nr:glutamate-5-semialdehyde dehydrogenase [Deltaproteobacteria bacterium]
MDLSLMMDDLGRRAKAAARVLAAAPPAAKALALDHLADLLESRSEKILAANARDVQTAVDSGMDAPRLDRLTLTPALIGEMAAACRQVAAMPDPVGAMDEQWQNPNGVLVGKMRVPLGVVAMIYESRPNVTIDAAALCLKAGNAVILRGGSEAIHSNLCLAGLLHEALEQACLPADAAQVLDTTDRAAVGALCKLDHYVDVLIPRGGEDLVRTVTAAATMPVLKHDKGVCHIYVDADADLDQAATLIENSKVQRPGVCNALECLLVHRQSLPLLPRLAHRLAAQGVEFRADAASLPLLIQGAPQGRVIAAGESDWGTEFHDLILAVRVVDTMDEALTHIASYNSRHTEVICTRDLSNARRFLREVDASMTGVNVSTRFNDGGQLGLGAEIGISTSKLHAYGPMGVRELTTTKFVVTGEGQVRK